VNSLKIIGATILVVVALVSAYQIAKGDWE